ncbi:MAG TPA: AraC family ligand binding domain-containing protein [Nannocystaceae bacterium]|nr:AraC family ligand binding domain-containing protein [Nannocystaceae bacterium]
MPAASDLDDVNAVLPCADIDDTVVFFSRLGLRLEVIFPADDPAVAIVAGHGLRLRLQRDASLPSRVLAPLSASAWIGRGGEWKRGRAGMRYRDLVPDRLGGHLVASQIRIDDGGPVPDYVHWHEIDFQLIYCRHGWVRVVYEDQGEPFVLQPGDCVLQPPRIRHRVLESSPGLEVIELGCPALHETRVDHELELPTSTLRPDRDFSGQRFVRHVCAHAAWQDDEVHGFAARELGIAQATSGRARAQVLRARPGASIQRIVEGALAFDFVLAGTVTLAQGDAAPQPLTCDDVFVAPAGCAQRMFDCSDDLELLEIVLR